VCGESALTSFNVACKREDLRKGRKELLLFLIHVLLCSLNMLILINPNCPEKGKRRVCEERHGRFRAEIPFLWLLGVAMI